MKEKNKKKDDLWTTMQGVGAGGEIVKKQIYGEYLNEKYREETGLVISNGKIEYDFSELEKEKAEYEIVIAELAAKRQEIILEQEKLYNDYKPEISE